MSGNLKIYLDNASLTPVDKRVASAMAEYSEKEKNGAYGNPSSIYGAGVAAKKVLDRTRSDCALFFNAHADEIVFTGSGTEANNIAMLGVVEHLILRGKRYKDLHIIVSAIEHASILETAYALAKKGVKLDILPVASNGIIEIDSLKKALKSTTVFVSIMTVNNEIGTIQPIQDVVKIIRDFRKANHAHVYPLFHTDACQALLYMHINLEKSGVDLLTADSHKIYGPRGIGMLYVRRSARNLVAPIMHGGGQEKGLRPGTENMPGIVGFAKALEIAAKEMENETARIAALRDYCVSSLLKKIPNLILNGDLTQRIANNINISIPGIDHEFLLLQLDVRGIACSTKSSCLRDEDESYVIRALHRSDARKNSVGHSVIQSLRFSLGRETSKKDLDYFVKTIDECIHS